MGIGVLDAGMGVGSRRKGTTLSISARRSISSWNRAARERAGVITLNGLRRSGVTARSVAGGGPCVDPSHVPHSHYSLLRVVVKLVAM